MLSPLILFLCGTAQTVTNQVGAVILAPNTTPRDYAPKLDAARVELSRQLNTTSRGDSRFQFPAKYGF